ncbi:fructose-1,6-bisphosphatase [Candidatus Peregrinibacteria bacterium]|nr:fructose-1,6-bisphosphatase [Candidatus Peregrinibacteria bacterium]
MQLLDSHLHRADIPDSMRHLIMYISRAAKYIHYHLQIGDLGAAGTQNASGEAQMALDVVADKITIDNLMHCRLVNCAASEEQEKEFVCPSCGGTKGEYSVAFDPLDGSSLIDANLAIGSIFGIYKGKGFVGKTGRDQAAALYIVYGPRTCLVYSAGKGVHEFHLNDVGEFTLVRENLTVAETAKVFAPGNLRCVNQNPKYKALMDDWMAKEYTLRYSGGMVPDINHIFMKGQGIFTYPPYPPKYPDGKLRLLFECAPFAYLMEQAGGAASNGSIDILDIKIKDIHQRTPIYIGSKKEVEKAVKGMM